MYHGGPVTASFTFSRNSSAFGPTMSTTVIYRKQVIRPMSVTCSVNLKRDSIIPMISPTIGRFANILSLADSAVILTTK